MREFDKNYCDICSKEITTVAYLTNEKTYCINCGLEKWAKEIVPGKKNIVANEEAR